MDSEASHIKTVCPSYSVALELLYFMNSRMNRQKPVTVLEYPKSCHIRAVGQKPMRYLLRKRRHRSTSSPAACGNRSSNGNSLAANAFMPKLRDGMYQSSFRAGSSHFPASVPLSSW
jgi:hypothetical protein